MAAENIGRKPAPAKDAPLAPGALVSAATEAARDGAPWVSEPVQYDAILLASFGGPNGQDDVIPFLRNVTGGRGIPDERLEEVAVHYRENGGKSPINDQNLALKKAIEAELGKRGVDLPVYWGNRNWLPYMNDAVRDAHENGAKKIIALATSAYSSYSSCRQYREDFADLLEDLNLQGEVEIDKVRQFFDHPGFVTPFVDGVRDALDDLKREDPSLDLATDVEVLFTTHSVPTDDANRSGPEDRNFGEGGAYFAQHLAVSEVVVQDVLAQLKERGDGLEQLNWQLVFQSRSGPPSQPWLEPDINDVIEELPAKGRRAIIVVPVGFVSDHMEVLWDLDNEAKVSAADAKLAFRRTPTPGIHPEYVSGLVDLILERVNGTSKEDRPARTDLGPWYDVCRPGCCENVRLGFRPAVAGLQP
ncbi:ferrochelatase [Gulosibacter chungangensis]|uniref:Coproporphyrin III ferrochelatase n=1 Tax=Gulosibacter chungangensis TaxID=979746 RepID=A0A7J5B9K2_9MICO|nr:ferrochelatase [Gulosibacter chungangensis]KAB1642301.1 ferrochelatase [Gulosibacter chungangensis]